MDLFFRSPIFFGEESLNSLHLFIGRWFDYVMYGFTVLGNEIFYTVIPPIAYWCYEKKRALKLIVLFLASTVLNDAVKDIYQMPRPDPTRLLAGIRELNVAYRPESPGFPSGHTQGSFTFWGAAFWYFRNPWVRTIALLLIILIPYSRIYLAVHFFGDVVGGYFIGIITLIILIPLTELSEKYYMRIKEAILTAILVVVPFMVLLALPGKFSYNSLGALSGFAVGALAASGRIAFEPRGSLPAALAKTAIGLAGIFMLKEGLKLILPSHWAFGFLRYWTIGFWCTFIAPLIFTRFSMLKGSGEAQA